MEKEMNVTTIESEGKTFYMKEETEGERVRKYIGIKWGSLDNAKQTELLSNANTTDAVTGEDNRYDMPQCIVDLTEYLSVPGKVVEGEIIIDDDAVIYCPVPNLDFEIGEEE